MQKILIITHSQDNESVAIVSRQLEAQGATVIRFNVDLYPLTCRLTTCYQDGQWQLYLDHGDIRESLHDVTALWYRRSHNLASGLAEVLDPAYLPGVHGEVRQTLFGMLESLPCFQLGKYSQYRRMDSKEEQLKLASMLGLQVPDTCITNNPEEAAAFVRSHPGGVVAKMQSSFAIYQGQEEHVVFTNIVSEHDLEAIETLQYCPMQFQQKLEKARELRVTIVGDAVFCFSIDSQQLENARIDWRREGVKLLERWEPYTLPAEVQQKLLQLMDIYGVNYGAIDIIVTPEGDHFFLEINAAGEYFWLDRLIGNRIAAQIADVLTGKTFRRYQPFTIPASKESIH